MTAEPAVKAVKNACLNVRDTKGIILHSGLGSQYTSQVFEKYLESKGIQHSFSRKGNLYDNACIESFHSVLKKEEIYLHTCQDSTEARRAHKVRTPQISDSESEASGFCFYKPISYIEIRKALP